MLYCERCHNLYESVCPLCRKNAGRIPKDDDLCFVIEESDLWAGVVEDILRQAGVPCVRRQAVGVAPMVGVNLARYRFYVPYHRVEEAMTLLSEVLSPVEDTDMDV